MNVPNAKWPSQKANEWFAQQGRLMGANYVPASAINQIAMWQDETFDPVRIDLELGWAKTLGMNTMRVFLHDLLWEDDCEGFKQKIDSFLSICERHNIRPMLVLFDSVWDPFPKLGPQREPVPGLHNSGWAQGPGAAVLADIDTHLPRLKAYVQGVVGAFGTDSRILAWDLWNEPDNDNGAGLGGAKQYGVHEPQNKAEIIERLLPQVFSWARETAPAQPLTSGVWIGDWSPERIRPVHKMQLDLSDIISFHNYDHPEEFEARVKLLQRFDRPLFCTEYMARGRGNTFENILPLARKFNIAVYNWGFVEGASQTHIPWDSYDLPYVNGREPEPWFHDIFHRDGRPYREEEVAAIRQHMAPG